MRDLAVSEADRRGGYLGSALTDVGLAPCCDGAILAPVAQHGITTMLGAAWRQVQDGLFPRRRLLREIRATWGRPGRKDGWLSDQYFQLTRLGDSGAYVDDRTWADLEFPRIFARLDSTQTRLGSQCLYRQVRRFAADVQQPQALLDAAEALGSDSALRESIQLALAALDADSGATVIDTLFERTAEGLKYPRVTVLWSVVCVAMIGGMSVSLVPLGFAIPLLAVNVAVTARGARERYGRTEAFRFMHRMVSVAQLLARLRTDQPVVQLHELATERGTCERVRRALRVVEFTNRLPLGLGNWLNLLCLADWVVYRFASQRIPLLRTELLWIYDLVGSLDATIALASFLEQTPTWCRPCMSDGRDIEIEGGCHPLLPSPVPNSLEIHGRSALISGSNMGGKTTFIKMIGINVIFGRNLGMCLATRARIPSIPVMACIRSQQSVESGKSRYFDEIEAILSFLRCDAQSPLLVLDEPFSGTNTTERIAAAKAVLAALSVRAVVLATTHDVELQGLLADQFDLYHFLERPDLEALFDYHLRSGPCTEGNALRLLARVGFPPQIVADAIAYLTTRGSSAVAVSAPQVAAMPREPLERSEVPCQSTTRV